MKEAKTIKRTNLLLLLLLFGQLGCALFPSNPRVQLLASQKTFASTVDSLTTLLKADKFSVEETKQITILIHAGDDYLDEWDVAIQEGKDSPDMFKIFNDILGKLIVYYNSKEGDT